MAFDKNYFQAFLTQNEDIATSQTMFLYLDEIFYLIRGCGVRSLSTLNKVIACSFLNHLQGTAILEDLYSITVQLLGRMLKKEYFNSSMICLSNQYNIYNMVVIILMNNAERSLLYCNNLKTFLLNEQNTLSQHYVEPRDSQLIVSCLEEMDSEVHRKFSYLIEEQMKFLVDNLKLTVRELTLAASSKNFTDKIGRRKDKRHELPV